MATLAEQISQLANPAPIFHDPEDVDDSTAARLTEKVDKEDDGLLTLGTTSLRRKNALLLVDADKKYAGKKVSRKALTDQYSDVEGDRQTDGSEASSDVDKDTDDTDDGSDSADDNDDGTDEEGEVDEEEESEAEDDDDAILEFQEKMKKQNTEKKFEFEDDGDYSKYADEEDEDDDVSSDEGESGGEGDNDPDDSDDEEEEEDSEDEEEEESGIRSFSRTDANEEKLRGEATRNQLGLWDSLLKSRIEMQKLMSIVNQLPQPDTWHRFVETGGDDHKVKVKQGQACLKKVLDELVHLQTALLLRNPETRHVVEPGKANAKATTSVDDDEEIPSDSDAEEAEVKEEAPRMEESLKRKIKMADYPEFLAKRHKSFQEYRNNTIQKWHDKTRVASGRLAKGFSAFDQSALKQIDQILSDRERLIQRTQLKRTVYRVLGQPERKEETEEDVTGVETEAATRDPLKDYDEEIFDDGDFYQQLLRELIERKTSDISDPIALSRQWLEIQKLRSKVKRKVDTRASKGRKVRYDVHPKLVNFMAPSETSSWTEEAKNELFSSIFGQRHHVEPANGAS